VTTGIAGGTATQPVLDLTSTDKYNGTGIGNVLTIIFTYSQVGPLTGEFLNSVGGHLTSGSDVFSVLLNGNPVNPLSYTTSTLNFSGDVSGGTAGATSFGIMAVLTANSKGTTSFTDHLSVPDGGITVAMLGFGLVGVSALRRKFSK
jgi:hypothetical protein